MDAAFGRRGPGSGETDGRQGQALALGDPEPWPEPVDGADLLDAVEALFLRYIALPEDGAAALALWVLHSYAHEAAAVSPLLILHSPVKRCGKTTALHLLAVLTRRPLPTSNISPSAIFRSVERFHPTLLIDEADSFLRMREDLRGIVNCGHTRATAFVVRTVGEDHEPRRFSTWAPKAVALIGRLPSTVEDRGLRIAMRRRTPAETVERLRPDRLGDAEELSRKAFRWSQDHLDRLLAADPEVPKGVHDRAADNWRPLLAIADAAGGRWPDHARCALAHLTTGEDGEDSSLQIQLLSDIRRVFGSREVERLFTKDLLGELHRDEKSPWGELRRGQPLTPIGLARHLKPFGIKPQKIRIGEEILQGYHQAAFADAFERYLPAEPEHPERASGDGLLLPTSPRNGAESVPADEGEEEPGPTGGVPGVPAPSAESLSECSGSPPDREVFEL